MSLNTMLKILFHEEKLSVVQEGLAKVIRVHKANWLREYNGKLRTVFKSKCHSCDTLTRVLQKY